jgi:hypothetical protein
MPKAMTSLARSAAIAAALALWSGAGFAETVTVSDARPVAKAIIALEMRYGVPITYEDPPYMAAADVVEMDAADRRDKTVTPGSTATLVPRGGSLTFSMPPSSSAAPAAAQIAGAVADVVQSYNSGRGGSFFAARQDGGATHVVPVNVAGSAGQLEPATPILSRTITVAPMPRTAFALIDAICARLAADSKATVVVGTSPVNFLMSKKTSIGASNETARAVLDRLIAETGTPLSWQLFYDPGLKWYVLNIHIVRSAAKRP